MKNKLSLIVFAMVLWGWVSCGEASQASGEKKAQEKESMIMKDNALTEDQVKQGWRLLFDGETTKGWHTFNEDMVSPKWSVVDGILVFNPEIEAKGGDLVTDEEFENFHLKLDWKVSECGNSGIIFNIQEEGQRRTYHTGPEMQILDDSCHPDAEYPTHRAGSLYDLIQAQPETVKPAGEWNTAEIILDQGHLIFKLNGVQVVETHMFNKEWDEMLANSKFKQWPGFGTYRKGRIGLQDHGDLVEFKNIMIKEL